MAAAIPSDAVSDAPGRSCVQLEACITQNSVQRRVFLYRQQYSLLVFPSPSWGEGGVDKVSTENTFQ